MSEEPHWGPATTYRSAPKLRRGTPDAPPRARGETPPATGRTAAAPERQTPRASVSAPSYGRRDGRSAYAATDREAPPHRSPSGGGGTGGPPGPPRTGGSGGSGGSGASGGMSRQRRRGLARLTVFVLILAVVAYPVLLGVTGYRAIHRVGTLPATDLPDTPGRTVLLVGSDSRANLTRDQQVQLSTGGDAGGDRTDTIMLLHTPAHGGPTVLLSIPRDSYVAIPGHSKSKINAAFSWGGPDLLAQTVEQATGIRVDGYAETGLGGFAGLVDAVGGVTMCPAKAIKDPKAGLDIPAGCQVMDGPTALGYARTRDFDPNGDLGRAARQRELIGAIAAKAATPSVLVNPFTAFPLAKAGGGALTVDDSFGPRDLVDFVGAMKAVAGGNAVSLNVPVARADLRTPAGLAISWKTAEAKAVFDAINSDDTEALRAIAAQQPTAATS